MIGQLFVALKFEADVQFYNLSFEQNGKLTSLWSLVVQRSLIPAPKHIPHYRR